MVIKQNIEFYFNYTNIYIYIICARNLPRLCENMNELSSSPDEAYSLMVNADITHTPTCPKNTMK